MESYRHYYNRVNERVAANSDKDVLGVIFAVNAGSNNDRKHLCSLSNVPGVVPSALPVLRHLMYTTNHKVGGP